MGQPDKYHKLPVLNRSQPIHQPDLTVINAYKPFNRTVYK